MGLLSISHHEIYFTVRSLWTKTNHLQTWIHNLDPMLVVPFVADSHTEIHRKYD